MADMNALYRSLLAADEAGDAAALAAVAWQMYAQLAMAAADLGALRARFRAYAAAPHAGLRADVERLLASPLLPPQVSVSGHVYDVETGRVTTVPDARHPQPAGNN